MKFYSQASLHIAHMAALERPAGTRALYACPRRYSMEVYAYGPEGLLLANSFDCNSTADRLYYLLYVWKQLGFDQEKTNCTCADKRQARSSSRTNCNAS